MQVDEIFGDRQAEAGALLGRLDRVGALTERGEHDRDLVFGMPGPLSLTLMYCPPAAVQPTLSQISPPCGVNLIALDSRLRQICRHRALVRPQPRQVVLEHLVDRDAAVARAQLQQMVAVADHAARSTGSSLSS